MIVLTPLSPSKHTSTPPTDDLNSRDHNETVLEKIISSVSERGEINEAKRRKGKEETKKTYP
jgi:hypothetical protein